jgi:hypothetical protein
MTHGNPLFFNINDGGLEAQVHGYRAGLLKQADYNNLTECDNLDGKNNKKYDSHCDNRYEDASCSD